MAINSKKKGNKFERIVAKLWSNWTGYEFNRTPQSGGLHWKNSENVVSDIICSDSIHSRRFQFSIEAKCHKDINFEHLLLNVKSKIREFWKQASHDGDRTNKIPILMMRYNGMPKDESFFVVNQFLGRLILKFPLKSAYLYVYSSEEESLYIFLTSDVMANVPYKELHKIVKYNLKSKS